MNFLNKKLKMAMNKLDKQLQTINKQNRVGLMTHVVVGYPSIQKTIEIVKIMAKNGADIIEMQIPFSDPIADGTTIMRACEQSLKQGTKVKDAITIMQKLSQEVSIPLLFMAYFNTIFVYGVEKFCKDANRVGASGLIVPDIPIDEEQEEHFYYFCKKYNLIAIHVVSPASTEERLKKNAKVANGFIYCTAHQGITGVKDKLDPDLISYLKKIKKYFSIPIAVGFGIAKREHVKTLEPYANIVVIGSAIIDVINNSNKQEIENNIRRFIVGLKSKPNYP